MTLICFHTLSPHSRTVLSLSLGRLTAAFLCGDWSVCRVSSDSPKTFRLADQENLNCSGMQMRVYFFLVGIITYIWLLIAKTNRNCGEKGKAWYATIVSQLESRGMFPRSQGNPTSVCFLALWLTGDFSRLHPASRPGTGLSPPWPGTG